MSSQESSVPAFRVTREPKGLYVRVPVTADGYRSLLNGVWILVWAVTEVALVLSLLGMDPFSGGLPGGSAALTEVLLVFFTLAGGVVIWRWIWEMGGVETFLVERDALVARREIWGFGRSRRFGLRELRSVKCGRLKDRLLGTPWGRMLVGREEGGIVISCAGRTYEYAKRLPAAEAWDLGEVLEEEMAVRFHMPRFPGFRSAVVH